MNEQQRIEEILAAEQPRREPLVTDDHTRVSQLFADELVYVHTTGLIHDKAQYLAYARDTVAYLSIERGDLKVRVHRDVAIMTGTQTNLLKKRSEENSVRAEGFVTQVWARGPAGWQIASFHGSRLQQ